MVTIKPKLYIDGTNYYSVADLQHEFSSLSSTFFERYDVNPYTYTFKNGKSYIEASSLPLVIKLIDISCNYYLESQALAQLGISVALTDIDVGSVLSQAFENITFKNHQYYLKKSIDNCDFLDECFPLSSIVSHVCGKQVVYWLELSAHLKKIKADLYSRIAFAQPTLNAIFSDEHKCYLYSALFINKFDSDEHLIDYMQSVTAKDIFVNTIKKVSYKKDSYEYLKEFAIDKARKERTKNSFDIALERTKVFSTIYANLRKELYDYSEDELKAEILSAPWSNNKLSIQYYDYVRKKHPSFAPNISFVYKSDYDCNANKDIYTNEEWMTFFDYLANIQKHVRNAYEDYLYAQYWVIMQIYTIAAIRFSDIKKLEGLNLNETRLIGQNELIMHPIEIAEAQAVVNNFRIMLENERTEKTNAPIHFYPQLNIVEALGTALCILEFHRTQQERYRLFTLRDISSIKIQRKFKDLPIEFKTTKATKTLLSIIASINRSKGDNNAYVIASSMRSHKSNGCRYSSTTQIYLEEAQYSSFEELAENICARGAFGWMYTAMLDYISGHIDSMSDATTQIERIQQNHSPQQLEQIATFLIHENKNQRNALTELSRYDRSSIALFLSNLGNSTTASSVSTISCIKGQKCCNSTNDVNACLLCPFSMKTTYSLLYINDLVIKTLNELLSTERSDFITRAKLSLVIEKALLVLMDAREWLDKYDKNLIGTFVDLPTIESKYKQCINSNMYLLLEGTS